MKDVRRVGGVAALVAAATWVVGFILFATTLSDYTSGDPNPGESVAFLLDHEVVLYVWNVIIFIIFGIALVPIVLALHEQLKSRSSLISSIAVVFGLVWVGLVLAAGMVANIGIGTVVDLHEINPAQAETVWATIDSIGNGLGGGNEITGGIWVVLVSWAALKTNSLQRFANYLGMVIGVAGIITIVPALEDVGAVFGIGLIVWFIWVGVLMLRNPSGQPIGQN